MKNPIRNYWVFLCLEESTRQTQDLPARWARLNRLASAHQSEKAHTGSEEAHTGSEEAHVEDKLASVYGE